MGRDTNLKIVLHAEPLRTGSRCGLSVVLFSKGRFFWKSHLQALCGNNAGTAWLLPLQQTHPRLCFSCLVVGSAPRSARSFCHICIFSGAAVAGCKNRRSPVAALRYSVGSSLSHPFSLSHFISPFLTRQRNKERGDRDRDP